MIINSPLPTPPPAAADPAASHAGRREPGARISAPGKRGKSLDQKFAWPRPPLPMRPPRPCESFPGPERRAGLERGRRWARSRALGPPPARRAPVPATPFQSNGPGAAGGAGGGPGAGPTCLRSSPEPSAPSCLRAPSSFLVPLLTASRPRHRHGDLIRAYFLIETGPEKPGAGLAERGRGRGGGHAKSPNSLCHLQLRAPPPRSAHPHPAPARRAPRSPHLCFPYLIYRDAGVGSKLGT